MPVMERTKYYFKLLEEKRDQLLLRAQAQIAEASEKSHADWWRVRMILRGKRSNQ